MWHTANRRVQVRTSAPYSNPPNIQYHHENNSDYPSRPCRYGHGGRARHHSELDDPATAPGQVTYSFTQTGSFSFADLGDAAIKDGESFTLTMSFTCATTPFVQGGGLSFLAATAGSTNDLYDIGGGDNQFRLYIRPGDECLMFNINGWSYGYGEAYTKSSSYTNNITEGTPVTLGFRISYVNKVDAADENDYFTISSLPDSQIQIDDITDYNVVRYFNFSDLTNYTGSYTNAPAEMITTVAITKAGELAPEPATATLSLLALCGLAARRRR